MRITRLLAAAASLAVTASLGVPALTAPASAAGCGGSTGVTVVVDYNGLGGGVRTACYAERSGQTASTMFPATGFPLTYAQRDRGFTCRVTDVPRSDPCVTVSPPDAYWSLWWSDGKSGTWSYATTGAYSLKVPDGGYVGFSWDDVEGRDAPSASAPARASASPTSGAPGNSASPGSGGGAAPGPRASGEKNSPGGQGGPRPAPGSSSGPTTAPDSTPGSEPGSPAEPGQSGKRAKSQQRDRSGQKSNKSNKSQKGKKDNKARRDAAPLVMSAPPTEVVSADEPTEAPGSSQERAQDPEGLPGWMAPALIVVLLGVAGATGLLRRRGRGAGPGA